MELELYRHKTGSSGICLHGIVRGARDRGTSSTKLHDSHPSKSRMNHKTKPAEIISPRFPGLFILACVVLLLNGCAKDLLPLEPAHLPVSLVVEELEQRRDHLFSFAGVGSILVRGEEQRWSGKAFFVSELPDSLRIEIVNFFGQPILYVASDGRRFQIWQPGSSRAYEGPASGGALARLIEFPLRDREVLLLLAGVVPPWNNGDARLFRVGDSTTLLLRLEDRVSQLIQNIWLEEQGLAVTKFERMRHGHLEFAATFSDFARIEGWPRPSSIALKGGQARLSVKYESFNVNEHLDDEMFRLALPQGIEVVPW
jgi:hypothetical protein